LNTSATPNNGAETPKKEESKADAKAPESGKGEKSTDAKTITVSITAGSAGTSTQNAPSEGNKAPSEGKQEKGWPAAGEMARALCLTTIASPVGVDVRLRAEERARNPKQQDKNGDELNYDDVEALTQTCMTGLAPEKKAKEPTTQSPGSSEVVAQK
jgi:hypothetical protein